MLTSKEMYDMLKLKNKRRDGDAQSKFYKWYNTLPPEDKNQFDKYCNKNRLIAIILLCVLFCAGGSCMFTSNKDTPSEKSSTIKSESHSVTQETQKKEEANLFTVQNHIQDFYKSNAQTRGTGYPEVDCAFASHYQNEIGGLIYMQGKYTLSTDKATHTYNARYGAGSSELLYLVLDGQRVFWNEDREDYYQSLDFKKAQSEQGN